MPEDKRSWSDVAEELKKELGVQSNVVAIKYFKNPEDVKKLSGIENYGEPGIVCDALRKVIDEGKAVYFDASNNGFNYCSMCNGIVPPDEAFKNGEYMMNRPTKWFNSRENSKAHNRYEQKGIPVGGDHILALAPLHTCCISDPDVILIGIKPRAAFYLLAGLQNQKYEEISFPFVGESNCTDTWGYTYNTGKPGLSLGCKGERLIGGLKDEEVRLSLTPGQLETALKGVRTLQENGLNFPSYIPSETAE